MADQDTNSAHTTGAKNDLQYSGSPYLRQHAHNPVQWHEWSDTILAKAQQEDKPIIISIGYAACHWCHVMARESFMDPEVAAYMNEHFICIKIDREERPDLDQIYMDAVQLIAQSGGWPLNAFALPDGKPFFGGTYFPTHSWMKVLIQIHEMYLNNKKDIIDQAERVTEGINKHLLLTIDKHEDSPIEQDLFHRHVAVIKKYIDKAKGGLSGAPKFPMPVVWETLLLHYYLEHDVSSLTAVSASLNAMANGGIFDQAGGGFSRYTVDDGWKIPHFEKMLYDNGQLVSLYAHAYQSIGNEYYKSIITNTLDFVIREMMSPEGGFYSSLNADSEGEEGKFYVWKKDELEKVLTDQEQTLLFPMSEISEEGNWEDGKNILFFPNTRLKDFVSAEEPNDELEELLGGIRKKILLARNVRVRPTTDHKIVVAWNAIMLTGFIDAYRATGNQNYLNIASKSALFLRKKAVKPDFSVFHSFIDDSIPVEGFLDDYAFLSTAFIGMYEITFEKHWLEMAGKIMEYAQLHFYDKKTNLFFYTSNSLGSLIARKHESVDHVIPSSNSEMGIALLKAGVLLQREDFIDTSKRMLPQAIRFLKADTYYYANWARLYALHAFSLKEVAIMGEEALVKRKIMQRKFYPDFLYAGGVYENLPVLKNRYKKGKTTFYVCKNSTCDLPVYTPEEAMKIMLRNFGE